MPANWSGMSSVPPLNIDALVWRACGRVTLDCQPCKRIETMAYKSTTTLAAIRAASPCESGWKKLLAALGKTKADNEPLDLLTVLNSNGLDDALWVMSFAMPDDRLARHFQAWCAEQVLHIFEAVRPDDRRVRDQIEMLRRDDATKAERDAADAAAWAAARAAEAAAEAAARAAAEAAWAAQESRLRKMLNEVA